MWESQVRGQREKKGEKRGESVRVDSASQSVFLRIRHSGCTDVFSNGIS